ncbi:MAG: hypothetical protein ABIS86_04815 [Streptosporangiaceae bacterium]
MGILQSWSEGVLVVRRRTDEVVEVEEKVLVAGKIVPPAPPRRSR